MNDIIWYYWIFQWFEGRPPPRNSHWVATSGQFLCLPGKTARTGGERWRLGEFISSSQLPFRCWKSRAWLTEQQEETDAQIAAVRQRMKASDLWPTCFGYLDANLMEFNWTAWKCKVVFSKWPTGHWPARGKVWFLFFFTCVICKVPLIGSNASPPGWASTGGALGHPTRNRMVSYNQSWFEDGRSTCCQHLPWFAMPKRRWLTYLQVCASCFWQSNAPSKFRRLPGAETNQEVLPSQHGAIGAT